ncbi:MAG: hypothetical protein ACRDMZ_05810, partial [Solirubrobacteraceae bacterium]
RNASVPFSGDRKAHLAAAARIAVVDDAGNRLLEVDVAPAPTVARSADGQGGPRPAEQGDGRPAEGAGTSATSRPWTRRWTTWAIPTGVFGVVTGAFGLAALASYQQAQSDATKSGQFHLSDAEDNVRRGRTFTWITIGGGAVTLAFAIPTAIFLLKERGLGGATSVGTTVVPTVGDRHAGLAVVGQF